jgi:hypothetical protein
MRHHLVKRRDRSGHGYRRSDADWHRGASPPLARVFTAP